VLIKLMTGSERWIFETGKNDVQREADSSLSSSGSVQFSSTSGVTTRCRAEQGKNCTDECEWHEVRTAQAPDTRRTAAAAAAKQEN
jgi:hypothetical protein